MECPLDHPYWTLAGSSEAGVVYAVSIDYKRKHLLLFGFNLVSYQWKLLAESEEQLDIGDGGLSVKCTLSAVYESQLDLVSALVSFRDQPSRLYQFDVAEKARLVCVLVEANDNHVQFEVVQASPSLHYIRDKLVVAGAVVNDSTLRVYQVVIANGSFEFVPVCDSSQLIINDDDAYQPISRFCGRIGIGGNFLIVTPATVYCFTPTIINLPTFGINRRCSLTLGQLPMTTHPSIKELSCPSFTNSRSLWIMRQQQLIRELGLLSNGELEEN